MSGIAVEPSPRFALGRAHWDARGRAQTERWLQYGEGPARKVREVLDAALLTP